MDIIINPQVNKHYKHPALFLEHCDSETSSGVSHVGDPLRI